MGSKSGYTNPIIWQGIEPNCCYKYTEGGNVGSVEVDDNHRAEEKKQFESLALQSRTISEIIRDISSTLDLDELFLKFSQYASRLIPFDGFGIAVLEDDGESLKALFRSTDVKVAEWENVVNQPMKGVVEEETFVTRIPVLLHSEDLDEISEKFPVEVPVFQAGINTLLNVPLVQRGSVFGSLTLSSKKIHAYSAHDVELVEEMARLIAGSIANAMLFHRVSTAEKELQRLNEGLEKRVADRTAELEAFSYSVSHDLRAPLRTVDGFSAALEEDYGPQLDEQAKDYLSRIRTASQNMERLIDDMLVLSRIGRVQMKRKHVGLSSVAIVIMKELQLGEPERDVTVDIEEDITVFADEALVTALLRNLLGNAWKFTSKREQTHIEFGFAEQEKAYFVKDNGVGVEESYLPRLFEPFRRFHSAAEYKGTGIGLSIVKRVIERHGGRVWAESEVDVGTTFYFTLGEEK
ncbi:MAG: ATP-binding protein [Chloroflexi bacterium]|nr:ATP-binding protein [Chloroflexota bacterium]